MENNTKDNHEMSVKENEDLGKKADAAVTTKGTAALTDTKDVITRNLAVLKDYKAFAESLVDTDFGARFSENKTIDGKIVSVVNVNNIVACLLTGAEIGLSPMTALAYGRDLNLDAIQKVELGKTLGLSTTASLKNIFVFESGGNRQVYTGINVVEACLAKHKLLPVISEDFIPVYSYFDLQRNQALIDYDPEHHIDTGLFNDAYVDKMMAEKGMIPVIKVLKTYRTTATIRRFDKDTTVSYTLQEAIDAGLKSGKNSITGLDVKGKDNWDKHTRALMRKMAIMLAARICANDLLNGMYCDFEIKDANSIADDEVNTMYVEAEVVN